MILQQIYSGNYTPNFIGSSEFCSKILQKMCIADQHARANILTAESIPTTKKWLNDNEHMNSTNIFLNM